MKSKKRGKHQTRLVRVELTESRKLTSEEQRDLRAREFCSWLIATNDLGLIAGAGASLFAFLILNKMQDGHSREYGEGVLLMDTRAAVRKALLAFQAMSEEQHCSPNCEGCVNRRALLAELAPLLAEHDKILKESLN